MFRYCTVKPSNLSLSLSLFETTNGSKTLLILIMAKIRPISGRGTDRVRGYGVYGTD